MNTNAYESWSLYDTVLIGENAPALHQGAGFFADYAALSVPSQIPFFNVRNKSVGTPYCNFDSANKLPFVFHCYSIGLDIEAPLSLASVDQGNPANTPTYSNLFFSGELAKHVGFILKVSQDEKLVQTGTLMPSGQGIAGWQNQYGNFAEDGNAALSNLSVGVPEKNNRWKFAEPIAMPREVNIEGNLVFSEYAREALSSMYGPGTVYAQEGISGSAYPAYSQIRVTLYGMREVQQRNALHYS